MYHLSRIQEGGEVSRQGEPEIGLPDSSVRPPINVQPITGLQATRSVPTERDRSVVETKGEKS